MFSSVTIFIAYFYSPLTNVEISLLFVLSKGNLKRSFCGFKSFTNISYTNFETFIEANNQKS